MDLWFFLTGDQHIRLSRMKVASLCGVLDVMVVGPPTPDEREVINVFEL